MAIQLTDFRSRVVAIAEKVETDFNRGVRLLKDWRKNQRDAITIGVGELVANKISEFTSRHEIFQTWLRQTAVLESPTKEEERQLFTILKLIPPSRDRTLKDDGLSHIVEFVDELIPSLTEADKTRLTCCIKTLSMREMKVGLQNPEQPGL
ncbi:MAG: hypothetical protein KGJ02_05120 [Verrucomicrobiota bacterium]|nr:hypothetical protein [Verrucomicrobiota bacterium]